MHSVRQGQLDHHMQCPGILGGLPRSFWLGRMRAGHRRCQPGLLRLLPVLQGEARRRAETGPARPAHRGGWSRSAGGHLLRTMET